MKILRILALPVLSACTGTAPEPADTASADTAPAYDPNPPDTIGGERQAEVVLPSDYTVDRQYPLVILLHGYGVTADFQEVVFGLGQRVDALQFILVKPEGTVDGDGKQFWNATSECCDFDDSGVDDVAYLKALIDEARSLYPTSTASLVGHSNGGFMSYRMACETPERVDRVAVLAGAVYKDESDCIGAEPVSVLHIHGTEDDTIAYESDAGHAGALESAERWAQKAGCGSDPVVLGTTDYMANAAGEETTINQWQGCAAGIDVQLWRAEGSDHLFLDSEDVWRDDVATWAVQ
ncbi:MAG: hypothetical protein EXR69_13105 [Myxococcales bacterium]|nr:hypothetical protein [Myxococcales bacterium]